MAVSGWILFGTLLITWNLVGQRGLLSTVKYLRSTQWHMLVRLATPLLFCANYRELGCYIQVEVLPCLTLITVIITNTRLWPMLAFSV